jgi:hypothetical protein
MKNFLQILIINFVLLFVPITANATTIALSKTAVMSHEKGHQKAYKFRTKSDTKILPWTMRYFFVSGLISSLAGWGVWGFATSASAGLLDGILLALVSLGLFAAGAVALLIGIILWFVKVGKEEKEKR